MAVPKDYSNVAILTADERRWKAAGKSIPAKAGAKEVSKWLCGLLVGHKVQFYSWDKENERFLVAVAPEENEGLGTEDWQAVPMEPLAAGELCYELDPDLEHALHDAHRAALITKLKLNQPEKATRVTVSQLRKLLEANWDRLPDDMRSEAIALGVERSNA
jgi:hypothetical protein